MKLNSKSNLHFRFVLYLSYLILIWYPTNIYLLIIPIVLTLLDEENKYIRYKMLGIVLAACITFYFYLNNLDIEQQIGLSLVFLYLGFSDILKKAFKKNTI